MKRLCALFLACALLLCGCNGGDESLSSGTELPPASQPQQSEADTTAATATAATEQTTATTTQTTAAPAGTQPDECTDTIVPTLSDKTAQLVCTEAGTLDVMAYMRANVDYSLKGIDLESDEWYVEHRKNAEETYTGDKLEAFRKHNYFYQANGNFFALRGSAMKYALVIGYNYGTQIDTYSQILLITGNAVVYDSGALDISNSWFLCGGKLIAPAADKGYAIFDPDTCEISYLDKDENGAPIYGEILLGYYTAAKDYFVFGHEGKMLMYYPETGRIVHLDTAPINPHEEKAQPLGSKLYLYYFDQPDRVFDIETHEFSELSEGNIFPCADCLNEKAEYIVGNAHNKYLRADLADEPVQIKRLSDGSTKTFDLRKYFREKNYSDRISWYYSEGDIIYLVSTDCIVALDFEAEEMFEVITDHVPIPMYLPCTDKNGYYFTKNGAYIHSRPNFGMYFGEMEGTDVAVTYRVEFLPPA